MVGGLYKQGDGRRDAAFTIFYVGINIGAFSAPLLVGYIGEVINWHYGFALAGIGMAFGQVVYMMGQKYLIGIGDFVPTKKDSSGNKSVKLTSVERDRMVVLLLSLMRNMHLTQFTLRNWA